MDEVIGRLFLINYSLGTNSTVKPFKQLGVAKSTIYKVLQSLENWWDTEKQLASGRPAVNLTKGKRKQLVNAAMDSDRVSLTKNANKFGVHQIYVQREGLKYYKRKFTKVDFWEGQRPDSRSLVGNSWPWWLKKPATTVQAVMDVESYFINIRLLEDFFWFPERHIGARMTIAGCGWKLLFARLRVSLPSHDNHTCERKWRFMAVRVNSIA